MKKELYQQRRSNLCKILNKGLAVFIGNFETPINYNANCHHFRQDSSFLYFFGLNLPELVAVIDLENGESTLFGEDRSLDDVIWMGDSPALKDLASRSGIENVVQRSKIAGFLQQALEKKRKIHFLAPYQHRAQMELGSWLGIEPDFLKYHASEELIAAIVKLREVKESAEIEQIREAVRVSALCYQKIAEILKPGLKEYEIVAECSYLAAKNNCSFSFIPIITRNGQILHNHYYGNILKEEDLLLVDSGVETAEGYASDITRTLAVSGSLNSRQQKIYDLVLQMQLAAINEIRPGIYYRDVHLKACSVLAEGLKELGLMHRQKSEDIVASGAHALFFPHGLGHMLGLDVHDMENLGENYVGYDKSVSRSTQFGLAYLRLAKRLEKGFVLTVEPGIYFIPPLIRKWQQEQLFKEFINYEKLESYLDFGGVRIEDDILVTDKGAENLSVMIAK